MPGFPKGHGACAACVCHVYSTVLPLFSGLPGAVAGAYTASSYYTQRN